MSKECMFLENCGYWYQAEDDDFPYCHFPENDSYAVAPCEEQ